MIDRSVNSGKCLSGVHGCDHHGLRMSKPTNKIPPKLQAWIQARKHHHLSHVQVQMARELGRNPMKLDRSTTTDKSPGRRRCPG